MQFYVGHKQSPALPLKTMLDANPDKHAEVVSFQDFRGSIVAARVRGDANTAPSQTVVITTPNDVVAIATAIGMVHRHNLDRGYRD